MPTQSEISLSPISAKGDLLSTDGSSRTRVGVGSNNQILTARSSSTSGVQFETPNSSGEAGLVLIGSATNTADVDRITINFSLASRTSVVALYVTGIARTTRTSANETDIRPNGTNDTANFITHFTLSAGASRGAIMQVDPTYTDTNRYSANNYAPFYFYYAGPYSHSAGTMKHTAIGHNARINDGVTTLSSTTSRIFYVNFNLTTALTNLELRVGNAGTLLTAGSIFTIYGITKE